MKRWIAGSLLIVVGLFLVLVAALGAAAQTTGTCYVLDTSRECTAGYPAADMSCEDCLALTFPMMSWKGPNAEDPCLTSADQCTPTAVTFLEIRTPITACNAAWTVPGIAFLGLLGIAGGLVTLRRR